jgi:hypothetical protein
MPRSVDRAQRKAHCEECIPLDARQVLRNRQREEGGTGVVRWRGSQWADEAAVRLEHGVEHWGGQAEVVLRYWLDSRGILAAAPRWAALVVGVSSAQPEGRAVRAPGRRLVLRAGVRGVRVPHLPGVGLPQCPGVEHQTGQHPT